MLNYLNKGKYGTSLSWLKKLIQNKLILNKKKEG